jgi:hypothetical protein
VSIIFLNDFTYTYGGITFRPSIYIKANPVVINGKTYTALANILGGPVYDANSEDAGKKSVMLTGTLSDGGEYYLSPLAEDIRLPTVTCPTIVTDGVNILCFQIRGSLGSTVATKNEIVDIQYEDTTGTIRTLVKDYPLLKTAETIAVQGDPLFPIVRVIITFSLSPFDDGTTWQVPQVFITPTSISYNGASLGTFTDVVGGPGKQDCSAADLTAGKLPVAGEYHLIVPSTKYNGVTGRLSSVLDNQLGFAANVDPVLNPISPSISNAGVATTLKAKAIGPLFVSPDYELTFKIKPTATSAQWTNIMHFTGDYSQCCSKNSQLPAIYLPPNSLSMNIRMSTELDGNWGFTTSRLTANSDNNVKIRAVGNKVSVTIGTYTTSYYAPSTRSFGVARLFLSSPWAPPALAVVTNVVMTPVKNALTKLVSNQLTKSVNLPLNFAVKFSFTPTGTMSGLSNIMHITQSNTDSLGVSRMFALFIKPGSTVLNI